MRQHMIRLCLGLLPILAACGITDVQAPGLELWQEVGEPFVETLDAAGVESVVEEGAAEFELVLMQDGVTVSELVVRTEGDPRGESIQSRIEAFDEAGGGRVVLSLGSFEVSFAPETRFWVGDALVSREVFAQELRDDLAAGLKPPVAAERSADLLPQDPDDPHFVAEDVMLGGDGTPALRMRAGRHHVERVTNPTGVAPDAWLKLLGWRLGLRMRDGTTRAERHRHPFVELRNFEGDVSEIDLEARTLLLPEGQMVRLVGRTLVVDRDGFAPSLSAAAQAMAAGHGIRAYGVAAVEDGGGLLALKVALKIGEAAPEPEPEPQPEPVILDFTGAVTGTRAGDAGGTVLTLADGTSVLIGPNTVVVAADQNSPGSVSQLIDALAAGVEVIARGTGRVVAEQPLSLEGIEVELQGEAPAPPPAGDVVVDIADYVSSNGTIVLVNGQAVVLTSTTQVEAANANSPGSIQELMDWLDMNRRIEVTAEGTLDNSWQITAQRIVLNALVGTFDQEVAAVDPAGGLILADGSFVLITGSTVLTAVNGGPMDLFEVDMALASGNRVVARGNGFLMGRWATGLESHEAIAVEFEQIP